jgi:hypothetical protein
MEKDNLSLWHSVEKTNPKYTKNANVGGNKITAISPQFQIMNVTEKFGSYGSTWGFKDINLDYTLVNTPFKREKTEGVYPNKKVVGYEDAMMGLVVFKATFYYPGGEFPIINSISLFTNNDMTKLDDNFAKKVETDALTKAISKLGFNADIFLGKFDDVRYVEEMKKEFDPTPDTRLREAKTVAELASIFTSLSKEDQRKYVAVKDEMKAKLSPPETAPATPAEPAALPTIPLDRYNKLVNSLKADGADTTGILKQAREAFTFTEEQEKELTSIIAAKAASKKAA